MNNLKVTFPFVSGSRWTLFSMLNLEEAGIDSTDTLDQVVAVNMKSGDEPIAISWFEAATVSDPTREIVIIGHVGTLESDPKFTLSIDRETSNVSITTAAAAANSLSMELTFSVKNLNRSEG